MKESCGAKRTLNKLVRETYVINLNVPDSMDKIDLFLSNFGINELLHSPTQPQKQNEVRKQRFVQDEPPPTPRSSPITNDSETE
jgi:hypothetical protein